MNFSFITIVTTIEINHLLPVNTDIIILGDLWEKLIQM
jgi:hypothetical protein